MLQAEESHTLVPNREYEADSLGRSQIIDDAVFIQAISSRPRMIVRQLIPSGAVSTVAFEEGCPGHVESEVARTAPRASPELRAVATL